MDSHQGRFTVLLKEEASTLEKLYGVLMKELVALKEPNSDLISELSKEKNTILNELEKLDKERQLCVIGESDEKDLTFTNDINLLSSEIEICLNKCKQQNSINGGIIEMSQLFNEKMLDIICGNSESQTTYGASGKNKSKNNQHSLARV